MCWTLCVLGCLVGLPAAAAAGAEPPAKPPWQRLLQGDDARKAEDLEQRLGSLQEAGKFEEALPVARQLAQLRGRLQGADHWQAVSARQAVEAVRRALRQPRDGRQEYADSFAWGRQAQVLTQRARYREAHPLWEKVLAARRQVLGEEHPDTAISYSNLAVNLHDLGRYTQAQPLYEKALAIRRKALGEEHPETARSYNNLAANLNAQGRYGQAQPLYEKALVIWRRVLGEEHPETATSCNNLAANLNAQGRYAQAQPLHEKALAITRKVLGEEHPYTAASYNNLAHNLEAQGRYPQAQPLHEKALAITRKVLGEEHPYTANSYNGVAHNLDAQGRYAQAQPLHEKALAIRRQVLGEEHPSTAASYNNLASNLQRQGRYAQAQPLHEKALAIRRKVLGEEHPDTAASYNNVAYILNAQGQYAQAQPLYEKALAINRKVLGEEHSHTAASYNNLAVNLKAQGCYAQAQPLYEKALAICRRVLGEQHPDTAQSYSNLAGNLDAQGRHAQAQPLLENALVIFRRVLGEEHPATAGSYNTMAVNLEAQGRYAQAQPLHEKALAIRRRVLGEQHPDTAQSYNNLAANLNAQGRHAQAQLLYEKALAIRRRVLGEDHPDTANSYNNVAFNLEAQGRYAEAKPLHEKALAIRRKLPGEEHPDTAVSYNNLAGNLHARGQYKEAEEGVRKALAIRRKVLGEEHPDTAEMYNNLAANLNAQGRYGEAEAFFLRSADTFLASRLRLAASGLGRAAKTTERSPLFRLACVLARNGKPAAAWTRLEQGLGRGTWDDLSARLRRTPQEQARQAELTARLDRLDQLIERTLDPKGPKAEQKRRREELLTQRLQAQEELTSFGQELERRYGPAAGQVFDRETIQAALPADAALVGWVDLPAAGPKAADPDGDHWVVLLRHAGAPVWTRLRGSGPKGTWTEADTRLPEQLREALQSSGGEWPALAARLRQQRLGPLAKHLDGVRHLIVLPSPSLGGVRHPIALPSPALAEVPVEVFAPGYTVSYALSGTLYAHLHQQPKVVTRGLFALGDPVFEAPAVAEKPRPLPPGGVLVTVVVPGGNAAQSGLRPNDVLLRYGGTDLAGAADLGPLLEKAAGDQSVAVTIWRNGVTLQREVRPGKLGIVLAEQPAPEAVAELRRLDRRLASRGADDGWKALPGTRVEVEAVRRLFGDAPPPRLLLGSRASEQELYALAKVGELGKYRYVHLATHGEVDNTLPLRSAIILSRDALPDPLKQLEAGLPIFDGRLEAREVLEQWHLNADLVTLSACQTALGKYERGEGFVGFAQALILCGSRSVCLSLWKVDDTATALLMHRFYANLLGKRDGLQAPLPKAAALREAKEWLQGLSRAEALRVAAAVSQGVQRGKGRVRLPLLPEAPAAPKEDRPYAHPYYWAAFVLIGDPD
jgi:tetratricopeptide (TPR) repeat protein